MAPSTPGAIVVLVAVMVLLGATRYAAKRLILYAQSRQRRAWASPSSSDLEHPQAADRGFVGHRLRPRPLSGLPLTLAAVGMLYVLFLLSGAGADMLETEAVLAFDGAVDSIFDPWRTTFLTQALLGITQLGDMATLIAVVLVSTGFLWADGRPRLILPLWVCVVGSETATWLGKYGFDRARPEFVTEATALSPAFPSSHAAGALAVYGFVAYALACNLPGLARRFELVYWTAVLILLIAFSRIFLSVHFATDTAAGLLVGGFWLLVGIAVSETRHPARRG